MVRILVLRETSVQRQDTSYAPPITCRMHAVAIWESLPLPTVSRRIRWKLTGFELGPHFPWLNKWRGKCF